ncbi:MAG: hypothetical protein RLZ98_174 [Pseudomonadota bacterium]|jgi:Fur family ferric uptake transcriptional regulator
MPKSKKPTSVMEEALRLDGVRITRQRTAILEVLASSSDHPDATEVHRRAKELDETVSLATVYRMLGALQEKGLVRRHSFEGVPARFEPATDEEHHDHIIDVDSGQIIEFYNQEIEQLQRKIAEELGYEIIGHKLELYCRKGRGQSRS